LWLPTFIFGLLALLKKARDSMTRYVLSPVRLSHGWISQKRLKLGLCNFHLKVVTSL